MMTRYIVALLLCAAACGGSESGDPQRRWTGQIDTSTGSHYTATLFIGGGFPVGYFSAEAAGLSGALQGTLPSVTVQPDRCSTGFEATIVLRGDTAEVSYVNASCADAGSGSGTLSRY